MEKKIVTILSLVLSCFISYADVTTISSEDELFARAEAIDINTLPLNLTGDFDVLFEDVYIKCFKIHLDGTQSVYVKGYNLQWIFWNSKGALLKTTQKSDDYSTSYTMMPRSGVYPEGDYYIAAESATKSGYAFVMGEYVEDAVISIDGKFAGGSVYAYSSTWGQDKMHQLSPAPGRRCMYSVQFKMNLKKDDVFVTSLTSLAGDANLTLFDGDGDEVGSNGKVIADKDMTLYIHVMTGLASQADLQQPFSVSFMLSGEDKLHSVTFAECGYGTITSDYNSMLIAGDKVQIYATPDNGYKLSSLTVTGKTSGNDVTVSTDGIFLMPDEDVTISAVFSEVGQTGLQSIHVQSIEQMDVYSINGSRVASGIPGELSLPQGVYIVRQGGNTEKVLVK